MPNDFSFESKEQHWHLSPLSLGDMRKFKEWVQLRPWFVLQNHKDKMSEEVFAEMSKTTLRECLAKELTEGSVEVERACTTTEGIVQLAYLSLKRNHPAMTVEQCEDLITTRNAAEVGEKLMACSGLGAGKKN